MNPWDSMYQNLYNQQAGKTKDLEGQLAMFKEKPGWINFDEGGFRNSLLDKNTAQFNQAVDATQKESASRGVDAWSQMASTGGIDSGAAERIATNAGRAGLEASNNLRMANQTGVAGIEADTRKFGVDLNLKKYSEDMKGWAANKAADAIEKSGKSK
jgi:hypothetical protein